MTDFLDDATSFVPPGFPAPAGTVETAVIGIGCRLPGADDPDQLWDLIVNGRNTFRRVDPEDSARWGFRPRQLADPAFVPVTSSLSGPDHFDAGYFDVPVHEAALMDPQHRVFVEAVWAALEDAGHAGDYGGLRVGLFGSVSSSTYLTEVLVPARMWDVTDPNYAAMLANDKDFVCTRTAYLLGLTGPAVVVQSACSSSLVAVHTARAALAAGECDLAVVAASSISLPHLGGYLHRVGGIFSREGVCRPFDAAADGTVKGNGAVAVVLRRAREAQAAGDRGYAVIAGTAVNNDGRNKAGFPAPGVEGQRQAVQAALDASGLLTDQLGYVETHGTGTALGDPIEIRALSRVHPRGAGPACYLGSLKANLGHLDAAAGLAGLVKAALVTHRGVVPPMAGFRSPNPLLDLPSTRFVVPDEPVTPRDGLALTAVSAFGMGGTNAHAVLRPADPPAPRALDDGPQTLTVYGTDPDAVRDNRDRLVAHLRDHPEIPLADVAHTLRTGRRAERFRISARVTGNPTDALVTAGIHDDHERPPLVSLSENDRPGRRVALPLTGLRRTRHWIDSPGLAVPTAHQPVPGQSVREPAGDPEATVLEVMRRLLADPGMGPDTDYYDAGGDSLTGITLLDELGEAFGVELEATDVDHFRTPRELAARIRSQQKDLFLLEDAREGSGGPVRSGVPVVGEVRPGPAKGRSPEEVPDNVVRISDGGPRNLFLVHPAGGTTACYVDLARHLDAPVSLYGLHYPMAWRGERPSMRDTAARYAAAIRRTQPEGPYAVGGYSFGGNLAVELALQLRAAGQEVERLVLVDSHPPHAYTASTCDESAYLAAFPHLLRVMFPGLELDPDAPLDSPEQVLEAVRTPRWPASLRTQLAGFYQVWCDNHAALKRWTPDQVPDCPVLIVEASRPEPAEVLDRLAIAPSSVREWDRYLAGPVRIVGVDGDHYSIFRDPEQLRALGERLSDALR